MSACFAPVYSGSLLAHVGRHVFSGMYAMWKSAASIGVQISGDTTNAQSWPSTQSRMKFAGPMVRTQLTDVLVTGIDKLEKHENRSCRLAH